MIVHYWIAKNIEDPFRNETRNVGVIVQDETGIAARFTGEREGGGIDRRLLGTRFQYPDVYLQWVAYWRRKINAGQLSNLISTGSANFFVAEGGEVTDTGDDPLESVCTFLYTLLVSEHSVMQAFELAEEDDNTRALGFEIASSLIEIHILSEAAKLDARHPVHQDRPVKGRLATHTPSFSQQNGHLYVYEAIDFTAKRPKLIRERAGWMAYMYNDIKQNAPDVETFSIYRPGANDGDAIQYAKSILGGESRLVNWAEDNERRLFLNERQRVATSL